MFNPKYLAVLTRESFPTDKVICLGTQLISIVHALKDSLSEHLWYGADVVAVGKNATNYNVNDIQANLIGNDLHFIRYCSGIDQFIWGVFLCVDSRFNSQNIELETEDPSFRPIACNGILLEIRTFDTTFFEIYSEDKKITEIISRQFNFSELLCKD
ncbi:MAG: hypothetical protein ACRDAI_04290 [Candidatus Rhabdochlamydia sp.]